MLLRDLAVPRPEKVQRHRARPGKAVMEEDYKGQTEHL